MATDRMISLLVLGLLFIANLYLSEAQVGVCYGTMGDNLARPKHVLRLFAPNNITKVRLLEPNKKTLEALKGKNVDVLLGVPNKEIALLSNSSAVAEKWVSQNVKPYVDSKVQIKYIVVGNELSQNNENFNVFLLSLEAMKNVQNALRKQWLKDIKVTTSCDTSVIVQTGAHPGPSTMRFRNESVPLLKDIFKFLSRNGAPFMVSMYPYYELIKHPNEIKPEFALFTAQDDNALTDGQLRYQNKFDVMLDGFYTALENEGYPNIEIVVSETGWPSAGGLAASLENEKTYVTKLVQHVNKGTLKRPNKPIQVYFNLLDENQRGRPIIEKNFGVFTSDAKIKFPNAFNPSS
ncbi:hypothetical protein RND81_12G008100 [Saponaria officinalis]|uniref:Glucan endo-1,3-beta-D-glucosidase n=1 Tax=Saponaria officinalis TaxID=3572 RepID=A0AAW1H3T2_SAPOF